MSSIVKLSTTTVHIIKKKTNKHH